MNEKIAKFVVDFISRFGSAKPKFFAIIQYISIGTASLSSAIIWLQHSSFSSHLPVWVASVGRTDVVVSSIVAIIIAQLPKQGE